MIRIFSSSKRKISTVTLFAFLVQVFYPVTTFALTGGPSQPEYESFEPAGATEMVNLASGDFVYNIPLLDIDGYPINISYHGGANMEQEASWVGLGWTLNPGAINRGMRGLPDDFNGGSADVVTEQMHIKDNTTYGLEIGGGAEVAGFDFASIGLSMGYGIKYNTYKGLGLEVDLGVTGALTAGTSGGSASGSGSLSGGLGLKISNQDGDDFTMSGGIGTQMSGSSNGMGVGGALSVNRSQTNNSRRGIESDIVSGSASISGSIGGAGLGTQTGSSINLIPNTAYTPNLQFATTFSGITGEIHTGAELYWVTLHAYTKAFIFNQHVSSDPIKRKAYGYLNMENADISSVSDFNRDNDGTYYLECPKLPFANLTYDLYNANAQGLNELFRPYRNDFGYVHDNTVVSGGSANDVGIEGSYGNLFEIGFNDYGVTTNSTSGPWLSSNNAAGLGVNFKGDNQLTNNPASPNTYEHAYFKAIDEFPIEDPTFFNSIMGRDLAAFKLTSILGTNSAILTNNIKNTAGTSVNYTGQKKQNREARNTNFSFLNVAEASTYGLDKQIINHEANTFSYTPLGDVSLAAGTYTSLSRDFGSIAPDNHISEITVLKADGARYIYGIPVYNKTQKDAVFNIKGNTVATASDVVNFTNGTDNSTSNNKGVDQFYLGKILPAYAHSYLLTALLSKDYVDITGNGISTDDYGDYTKFNYSRTSTGYKWRNPCIDPSSSSDQTLYDAQWRSDPDDDKGIYMYGEKELWYTHSIETKNYVAEFHTSVRDDAKGVADEGGKADNTGVNNQSYRLDKIVLYSKRDLTTPIKTVNFKYNYSLCKSTPNSFVTAGNPNRGKLTLEKIYFTYGKSDKGVFSPYEFTYCDFDHNGTEDPGLNPNYDRSQMDRWGNYKVNDPVLDNKDFPYAVQDKTTADKNAAVWSLSSVVTPARSRIDVYYEADDYSYIQNKGPGQMLKMVDFVWSKPTSSYALPSTGVNLYTGTAPYLPNNYMVIDLSAMKDGGLLASSATEAETILRTKMLPTTGKLFFKGFVQLGSGSTTQDYVPGYSEFDANNSGILTLSSSTVGSKTLYKYAFIKLNEVDIEDPVNYSGDNCNPISKAAWQITRLFQPRIAYPGSEPGGSTLSACMGLMSAITEVFTFKQKNNRLRTKLYSRSIVPSKSFVRLNIPNKSKFGGGHRVNRIEITDNWDSMVSDEAKTTYGQTYNYTVDENNDGQLISSGVASYEPLAGGDEISLRSPIEYSVNRIAAPNDAHFFEYPVGEAFYPAPTVIYSKVTVRSLDRKDGSGALITGNIGRTEYDHYTAKDFPFSGDYDGMQSYIHTPDPVGDLFSNHLESSVHLSQGSILRLNDMHGKLKSVLTFQEGNNSPISGVRYYYKTTSAGNALDNTIAAIDETGTIANQLTGQHVEAVADFRAQNTTTYGNTISGNLNTAIIDVPFPLPIPIPSVFWGNTTETRDFYSATLNKVVTQQGILMKVEAISNYATSVTENLVWDAKTSDVILYRTTTNFRDFDYSYNTPAHWVYTGMGGAFKNIGYGFKDAVTLSTGVITIANGLLTPGDEVVLEYTGSADNLLGKYTDRLWVTKDEGSGNLVLMDRLGQVCNTTGVTGTNNVFASAPGSTSHYVLKVLRSGYKNQLDETAEAISFSANPRSGSIINTTANILNAGATEYSDDWMAYFPMSDYLFAYGDFGSDNNCKSQNYSKYCPSDDFVITPNPYIVNMKGNWTAKRSYAYLGNRLAKNGSGIMDIREDGTFETYKPFFSYLSGTWKEVYNKTRTTDYSATVPFSNWVMNSEVTKMSSHGHMLEAKDAINRYSASLYGYNHTMKTAVAANAKYREIGYDGFEDYATRDCSEDHFSFINYRSLATNTTAHTGNYSMRVSPGSCVSTSKFVFDPDYETAYGSNNQTLIDFAALPGAGATEVPALQPNTTTSSYFSKTIVPEFAPQSNYNTDQKYVLSLWVKENQLNKKGDYLNIHAEVSLNTTVISTLVNKSVIINGWQKLDYEFTIPHGTPTTVLKFAVKNSSSANAFFDDIRVQPFNANMGTYAYDIKSARLWAELDERNFATIYEYDNEGILVRVKKETERGIQTIKETRTGLKKN